MTGSDDRAAALHERLVRGLLHRGGRFVIGSPTGSWRTGPVALLRPAEPDRDAPERWWLIVPPRGPGLPNAAALPPEVRAHAAMVVISPNPPPAGVVETVEAGAGVATVILAAGLVAAGAQGEAVGAREEVVRTLAYDDAILARVDPDARYAALADEAEASEHLAGLRAAMPHAWVTTALVALCVLTYLGQLATQGDAGLGGLAGWGANQGALTLSSEPWRLLTSGFLHGGLLHLAINMWILWDLGQVCERLFGRVAFLTAFLAAVIAGSLASAAWGPWRPSVGASGGIFGLAGALLALVAVQRDALPKAVLTRLGRSVGVFVLANLAFGSALGAALRIDNAAHVGGLVGGAAAGAVLAGAATSRGRLAARVASVLVGLALLVPAARATPRAAYALDLIAVDELLPKVGALVVEPERASNAALAEVRRQLEDVAASAGQRDDLRPVVDALREALDQLERGGPDAARAAGAAHGRAYRTLEGLVRRAQGG